MRLFGLVYKEFYVFVSNNNHKIMKSIQVDTWTTREQLALASAVQSSGDQNWVAVSRAVRSMSSDSPRPHDWYNTKNCALQYAKLLESVTPAKRKREKDKGSGAGVTTSDSGINETTGEMLAKMLCKQHLEELAAVMNEERQMYTLLRREVEQLEEGLLDHQLDAFWEQMQLEEKEDLEQQQRYEAWTKEREQSISAAQLALKPLKGAATAVGVGIHRPGASSPSNGSRNSPPPLSPTPAHRLSPTNKVCENGPKEETTSVIAEGMGGPSTPSSPLLSSLLTRTPNTHQPSSPQLQDSVIAGQGPSPVSVPATFVQKLFPATEEGDDGSENVVTPENCSELSSSQMIDLPSADIGDPLPGLLPVKTIAEAEELKCLPTLPVPDSKSALAAVLNGVEPQTPKLERFDDSCGKQERMDVDSHVIKEDTMVITNKPETESQSSLSVGPCSGASKEGYQETVSSPILPKTEIKSVWDDMKGGGEVLQLGEVQRKYSRPRHATSYHRYSSDRLTATGIVKRERDSDQEAEEEEEDGGFAGFGPSSMSEGSRKIGSVMAIGGVGGGVAALAASPEEEEDVYNIDNDDTIGLKATSKQQKLREHTAKLSMDSEDSNSDMLKLSISSGSAPVKIEVGSPLPVTGAALLPSVCDTPEAASSPARRDSTSSKTFRKYKDVEKSIDFDDCDSVDSLATNRSSACDSDHGSTTGGGGRRRRLPPHSASALGSPHNLSDASPESPASTTAGDDPESEKSLRQWRKSIMILWNEIAAHKYASVFLRPITEEKVPGYLSVVRRPMDLQTIKRNIESGLIRTTEEFQRDIMLMCTNATVYNTAGHNIHDMAGSMLTDALAKIEEFQSAAGILAPDSPHKALRRETRESLAKRSDDGGHRHHKKKSS